MEILLQEDSDEEDAVLEEVSIKSSYAATDDGYTPCPLADGKEGVGETEGLCLRELDHLGK